MSTRRRRRRREPEGEAHALQLDADLAAIHARQGPEGRRVTELLQRARNQHRLTPPAAPPRPSTTTLDHLES